MRYVLLLLLVFSTTAASRAQAPDTILHHGKIVTVDDSFSIAEALAIRGERLVAVGKNEAILATKDAQTKLIDLQGRMVLPGLMDSHVHPLGAALHEFDHPIPDMETITDVLAYVRQRAKDLPAGEWIMMRQVFITRLREQRYPTRAELDAAAPEHPVLFSTGPDGMLNTLGLKLSGIDRDFKVVGNGQIEKDTAGEPTGMLRSCTRYAKTKSPAKKASPEQERARLVELFRDYNSVGLTTVADRDCKADAIAAYTQLRAEDKLTVRMCISHSVDAQQSQEQIDRAIAAVAKHPLRQADARLQIIGIKCYLDGGMLTGSAYMREPWGLSEIYSITDPRYRGVLFIEAEKLRAIIKTTVQAGLQFTAHSVGDGAITQLVEAYSAVDKTHPIRDTRPCITHANFMSAEIIDTMARLGIGADMQPAWLYLDSHTLHKQFGEERTRYFQPLKTLFEKKVLIGGGSDHMQKIGSLRSINPYDPWLGIWTAITRQGKYFERGMHPEQALTREQALRFYTSNNARLLFLERDAGSLEAGKLADLIVVDRDLLDCPVDEIKATRVLQTWLGGKMIYKNNNPTR
jgi:predicted amidohydrolase YtcJ